MKFIDLFGGIGGFRLGLEKASEQFECVDYIEYDKYAVKSYNAIFNEEHEPRDVTKLSKSEIPDHDLLCAGFPCQSFSVAGNRKGTDEARGKLFREIARIAEAKRPEMLLLENVKGILSQKAVKDGESVKGTKGHAFTEVLQALHELGYCLEWQVLNSKNWGVPQNRERVFIVGHLGGEPGRKVFPIGREDRGDSGEDGQSETLDTVHPNRPEIGQANRVYERDGLLPALNGGWTPQIEGEKEINCLGNVNPSGRGMKGKVYEASNSAVMPTVSTNKGEGHKILNPLKGETNRSWFWEQMVYSRETDVVRALKKNSSKNKPHIIQNHRNIEIREHGQESPTLNKKQGGGQLPMVLDQTYGFDEFRKYQHNSPSLRSERTGLNVVQPCLTPGRVEKRQNGRRMKEDDDPMFTLTGQDIHGVAEGKKRIRKLTPRECWRLQGFPDWAFDRAVEENSDTQLYKQAGNAVTVNVIEALGQEIMEVRSSGE